MSRSLVRAAVLVGGAVIACAARADFVDVLQPAPPSASTSLAFHEPDVGAGTTSADGIHDLLGSGTFGSANGLEQALAPNPPRSPGAGDGAMEVDGRLAEPGSFAGALQVRQAQAVPLPRSSALFACAILALGVSAARLRRR